MSLRKLRKLLRTPGPFFRDMLVARWPRVLNEVGVPEELESAVIARESALGVEFPPQFPIDVVYTWVDGSDPAWRQRYENHAGRQAAARQRPGDGRDEARFSSHSELHWSIHSVRHFMPWVRRIHIVTDAQTPLHLPSDDRIRIVDHRDIIDPRWLPTFNSHVIEAHLHRVPELAEHFVYFNDDVFAARALPSTHFFQSNGLASHFVSGKSLAVMHGSGRLTPTLSASSCSRELLRDRYGITIDKPLVHTYLPLRRSVYETVWSRHSQRIEAFLGHRTRGASDLNLASFLVPWTAYMEGLASVRLDICHYFNVRSPAAASHFANLLARKRDGTAPHSMCLNDFAADEHAAAHYAERMDAFLRSYFDASNPAPATGCAKPSSEPSPLAEATP